MIPIQAIRYEIGTLLATDVPYLAPVAANKMALIMAAFVPSETLLLADVTLATFNGSTPIAGVAGAQQVGLDPETGEQMITIKEPVGSWRWIVNALTDLPQTIYGYCLINNAEDFLLGSELLPQPITLTAVNQEINLGTVKLAVVLEPLQ